MRTNLWCRIEPLEARIAPAAVVELSGLDGTNGFTLSGVSGFDVAGNSVSGAGDVNGDGIDDFVVGAPGVDPAGVSYVIFGKTGSFAPAMSLGAINGTDGFRISGGTLNDYSGASVDAAGDVNGDGFDDLIIGAPYADPNGSASGAAYVIFGRATFAADVSLATLEGNDGFRLSGIAADDYTGRFVSGAGDINGDGFDDVIVGAPLAQYDDVLRFGSSFVVFGKGTPFAADLNLGTLDGSNGFRINSAPDARGSGYSVNAAGDINGDGFDDVIIGNPIANTNTAASGAGYVVFGRAGNFAANFGLEALNGANGFRLSGAAGSDAAGFSLSGAGDVNGDGFDDVIIGAFRVDVGATVDPGASYVVFGKSTGFAPDQNLGTLTETNGFRIVGAASDDFFGYSVSGAGDVNGDGFADIIVGAVSANPNGIESGASYVIYGKAGNFGPELNVASLNGVTGYKLNGVTAEEASGRSVGAAGDINKDGFADFIIGAPNADPAGNQLGAAYVVFGAAVDLTPVISISDVQVGEGGIRTKAATFTVTLSAPSLQAITVDYATSDGTATASADYTPLTLATLTFAPGETSKTVSVPITADSIIEPDETFFVNFSNATNAVLGNTRATGTILNDDAEVEITPSGKLAVIIEADGDRISIKTSKGILSAANFVFAPDGTLQAIDLGGDPSFANTNLSITGKAAGGGKAVVDVGLIDATDLDLAKVTISGNLGQILVGDGDPTKPALKSLTVGSLGTDATGIDPLLSEIRGSVRKITVKGDVRGAAVDVQGTLARCTIGGDLVGDLDSGALLLAAIRDDRGIDPRVGGGIPTGAFNGEAIGTFSVGGNVDGGSVNSTSNIGSVQVGGDLHSGAVAAAGQIRTVRILGKLNGDDPAQPAVVAALAQVGSTKPKGAVGIDTLFVRKDVENAQILLGFRQDQAEEGVRYLPRNADASAGKVVVRGDWTASSLVAGVFDATGDGFGQNDQPITGDTTQNIVARIASVVIKGNASGSVADGDSYAITTQEIQKLSIAGEKIALTAGKDNVLLDAANGDFRLVEI